MSRGRYERLVVIELSAGRLASWFGVEMRLEDGQGIGWTLTGRDRVDTIGMIGLECPADPDYELCHVYVKDAPLDAIDRVLKHYGLTQQSVLQSFE